MGGADGGLFLRASPLPRPDGRQIGPKPPAGVPGERLGGVEGRGGGAVAVVDPRHAVTHLVGAGIGLAARNAAHGASPAILGHWRDLGILRGAEGLQGLRRGMAEGLAQLRRVDFCQPHLQGAMIDKDGEGVAVMDPDDSGLEPLSGATGE